MADIELESLFDSQRWLGTWHWFYALLYLPVGLVLLILRSFILLQFVIALQLLPAHHATNRKAFRVMSSVLGLHLVEKNAKEAKREAQVYVSNCSSPFDGIAVYLATGACPAMTAPASPLALLPPVAAPRQTVVPVIHQAVQNRKLVAVFPESAPTSGRTAMLKFDAELLSSLNNYTMQGVVVQWTRPFPVAMSTLGASPYWDLALVLALPYSQATVHYIRLSKDEEIQLAFARALKIPVTAHTAQDKAELLKRRSAETQPARPARSLHMAQQVQSVLPDVPLNVIVEDVRRTQSVEMTIARLLDGQVRYTPLRPAPSSVRAASTASASAATSPSSNPSASSSFHAAAFGKTWTERGLSLQERKARFLDEARRKYIEKHGLQATL